MYELAFHLKMSVTKIYEEMSYDEFLGWLSYFERRPVDWRSDDRAFKFLQTQGVKEKPWQIFRSLEPIYNANASVNGPDGLTNVASFKSSALFQKLQSATSGDKVEL